MAYVFFVITALILCISPAQAAFLYTNGVEVMVTAEEMNPALAQQNGWRLIKSGNTIRLPIKNIAPQEDWDALGKKLNRIINETAQLSDNELEEASEMLSALAPTLNEKSPILPSKCKLAQDTLQKEVENRSNSSGKPSAAVGGSGLFITVTDFDDNPTPKKGHGISFL